MNRNTNIEKENSVKLVLCLISLLIILSLMILPQASFGQISTLNRPNLDNSQQCVDFNQDKICEFIVLANGTSIANPNLPVQPTVATASNTAQTTDFPPYENPNLGIRIQYPVGWNIEEGNGKVNFIQQKDIVSLETNVNNNIDSSLSEYVNTKLRELREQRQNFNLIESIPTTISGNFPAHKLVYTFLKEDGPRAGEINKVLRIWSIKDNKLYTIAYVSEADRFSDHLPEIEKTIDSFRINAVTQPASTRLSGSNNDNRNNERDNDNNQKNWRDDPDCWYYSTFVCDENGRCDSENFDCVTDCDDGSSVTTGQTCPGQSDEGVPGESDAVDDNDNDGGRPPSDNPYCDQVDAHEMEEGTFCFDRKDYSDVTGLYPCKDGSDVEDWRDCDDAAPETSGDADEESSDENQDAEGCDPDQDDNCVDDVEEFEGGDSEETATGDREYDPEGDSICGNDETGEEWSC
jgi:PsbP-like protein